MQEIQKMQIWSQGKKDSLEEETATHFSILAGKIPWTEEPGGHSPWGHTESDMTEQLFTFHINAGREIGHKYVD